MFHYCVLYSLPQYFSPNLFLSHGRTDDYQISRSDWLDNETMAYHWRIPLWAVTVMKGLSRAAGGEIRMCSEKISISKRILLLLNLTRSVGF